MIEAIFAAVAVNLEQLRSAGRVADVPWWQEQLDWLSGRRDELRRVVRS